MLWLNTPRGRAGYGGTISGDFLSGTALFVHVQCPLVHVQRAGQVQNPPLFSGVFPLFNIGLDFVLVKYYCLGVAGAAWATLIAQGISAVLSFLVFLRVLKKLNCGKTGLFDKEELGDMTKIALPSILQQSIVPIGWFANWAVSFFQYRTGRWKLLAQKAVQNSS